MWNFDNEKTADRIRLLQEYYNAQRLQACEFKCAYEVECAESHLNNKVKRQYGGGTAAVMPLYDASYDGLPLRVMIIGKETGYMKNSQYGTAPDFLSNNANVLNCVNWENKNNHIKGTLYILQYIFGVKSEYVYASYALSNLLRCAYQAETKFDNVSNAKDTKTMRGNCVSHLIEEIKILEPTLIITQGEWALKAPKFVEMLEKHFGKKTTIQLNSNGKYGLYEFGAFDCITTHHPAILGNWIKNLAPDTVWPMIDILRERGKLPTVSIEAGAEYERIAKKTVDPIIEMLPSNDLLRK